MTTHVVAKITVGLAIVPMVAVIFWLGGTSDYLQRPVAASVFRAYLVTAHIAVGLYWWQRRPASRFGPLLILFGAVAWVQGLQAANSPVLFAVGVLTEGVALLLGIYLVLAFPMGRLEPPAARWPMYGAVIGVVAFFVPWALFAPVIAGGGPLVRCAPDCPANPLQVATAPTVVDVAGTFETYMLLAVIAGVVAVYGKRVLTASRPARRALLAVAVTSLLWLPAYFAYTVAAWVLELGPEVTDPLQWIVVGTRALMPLGFLLALLQAGGFAARAQQNLLDDLAGSLSPAAWRDAVAHALDDPALRLGYQDLGSGRFREADGRVLEPPAAGSGRAWVPIDHEHLPVAAMVVDEALTADPELVRAACAATLVAVEHGALEDELRTSRSRELEAQRAERERIGRDLHDSTQQRLIALRIRLMLLGEQLDLSEERETVARLGDEVDRTIAELRDIAEGVTPPVLAARGVGPALEAVARRSPVRVTVYDSGIGRPPEAVETAIYFCCLECLQNAAKHAGPDALVQIRLDRRGERVQFTIEDDGPGFDPAAVTSGNGLGNLRRRVSALGGHVEVETRSGHGTRVSGAVPL